MRKRLIGVVLRIPEGQSITPNAFLDESDRFRWFVVVAGRLQVRFVFAAGHARIFVSGLPTINPLKFSVGDPSSVFMVDGVRL